MQPVKIFRTRALDVLRGNWKPYVLASLIIFLFAMLLEVPLQLIMPSHPGLAMAILYPLMFLVYMPLTFAFQVGFYDKLHGEEAPLPKHLCSLFKLEYGRALKAFFVLFGWMLLMVLGICLAAALVAAGVGAAMGDMEAYMEETFAVVYGGLVAAGMIPVIIWAYAISQMYFLAHIRKDLSIRECMKLSKKMMKGHKWQLFCLQLSFIGWGLLCVLTLFIGMLWLTPYQNMACAIFFDDLYKAEMPEEEVPADGITAEAEVAAAE